MVSPADTQTPVSVAARGIVLADSYTQAPRHTVVALLVSCFSPRCVCAWRGVGKYASRVIDRYTSLWFAHEGVKVSLLLCPVLLLLQLLLLLLLLQVLPASIAAPAYTANTAAAVTGNVAMIMH